MVLNPVCIYIRLSGTQDFLRLLYGLSSRDQPRTSQLQKKPNLSDRIEQPHPKMLSVQHALVVKLGPYARWNPPIRESLFSLPRQSDPIPEHPYLPGRDSIRTSIQHSVLSTLRNL